MCSLWESNAWSEVESRQWCQCWGVTANIDYQQHNKCITLESSPNHPHSPAPNPWKNSLPRKLVPRAKRLGTTALIVACFWRCNIYKTFEYTGMAKMFIPVFWNILQKSPNELFGQPNIRVLFNFLSWIINFLWDQFYFFIMVLLFKALFLSSVWRSLALLSYLSVINQCIHLAYTSTVVMWVCFSAVSSSEWAVWCSLYMSYTDVVTDKCHFRVCQHGRVCMVEIPLLPVIKGIRNLSLGCKNLKYFFPLQSFFSFSPTLYLL